MKKKEEIEIKFEGIIVKSGSVYRITIPAKLFKYFNLELKKKYILIIKK